jgi:hypothetical protein
VRRPQLRNCAIVGVLIFIPLIWRIVWRASSGDNPRWGNHGHQIGAEGRSLMRCGVSLERAGDSILSVSDALPSKKTRVDRPRARSEQCQSGPKSSQHDATPWICRMQERLPQREQRYKHPRDGRPQPCDQQNPQSNPEHVKCCCFGGGTASDRYNSFRNQCDTRHQPHQQQADTRQTVSECRIEASQMGLRLCNCGAA